MFLRKHLQLLARLAIRIVSNARHRWRLHGVR
jgi:hypothetical protein